MGTGLGIFVALVAVATLIRLAMGGIDRSRVRSYVESRGGRLLDARWAPFGPGWFGERSDRIYEVRYLDKDGNEHVAHCKTSMWTGVYFTEDRVVGRSSETDSGASAMDALEVENRLLREELERLRGKQQ